MATHYIHIIYANHNRKYKKKQLALAVEGELINRINETNSEILGQISKISKLLKKTIFIT